MLRPGGLQPCDRDNVLSQYDTIQQRGRALLGRLRQMAWASG